jgi:hypothetical protein
VLLNAAKSGICVWLRWWPLCSKGVVRRGCIRLPCAGFAVAVEVMV